jgi:hypothetical protein
MGWRHKNGCDRNMGWRHRNWWWFMVDGEKWFYSWKSRRCLYYYQQNVNQIIKSWTYCCVGMSTHNFLSAKGSNLDWKKRPNVAFAF